MTILSFYLDDTSPYELPGNAFKTFLDFASHEGIAGEASVILGIAHDTYGLLSRPTSRLQEAFIEQAQRAFQCGIDTHMELMTHDGLFDFERGVVPEGAMHEGLWLHEPEVTVAEYEQYFRNILAEGERVGIQFTGVTWPGCDCSICERRFEELRRQGMAGPNPHVWQALANLAAEGKFRGHTIPCFTLGPHDEICAKPRAIRGRHGVYDLPPNAGDRFGSYVNSTRFVDPDYYINAQGSSGRIVELVRSGAPYCLFYAHWQGLNPANGVGWQAFREVVQRIKRHLTGQIVWMRPSAYTDTVHAALADQDTLMG